MHKLTDIYKILVTANVLAVDDTQIREYEILQSFSVNNNIKDCLD